LDFDCLHSITSHGLDTFDYTPPGASADHHFISNVPFYDLDDGDGSVIKPPVDLVHAPLHPTPVPMLDPSSCYLYALDIHLQDMHSDCTCFYQTALLPFSGAPLHAHMDAGSMASTTDCLAFLWDFQSLDGSATTLRIADATPHHPTGIGYLCVPVLETPGFTSVRNFYTPSLPATILSPMSITSDLHSLGYSSFANLDGEHCCLHIHGSTGVQLTFPLQLQHGLLFTQALHQPPSSSCSCSVGSIPPPPAAPILPVQQVTKAQLLHLWHQHFGHMNHRSIALMHCFAKGVPVLPIPSDLDSYPVCLSSKLHCAARGTATTHCATWCYQGLSIDFGFFVQHSTDSAHFHQLEVLIILGTRIITFGSPSNLDVTYPGSTT